MRNVIPRIITAWIRAGAVDLMRQEAARKAPNETGGVLMGYLDRDGCAFLIDSAVGPGPAAMHARASFLPDHDFHEKEIARIYKESGRRITYLGDWHTHPLSTGYLSDRDLKTLKRIAADAEARARSPLMSVLAGSKWTLFIWRGELVERRFRPPKMIVEPVRLIQI